MTPNILLSNEPWLRNDERSVIYQKQIAVFFQLQGRQQRISPWLTINDEDDNDKTSSVFRSGFITM